MPAAASSAPVSTPEARPQRRIPVDHWLAPDLVFVAFALVLTIAAVMAGNVRLAGRAGLQLQGIDPAYYFGIAHSLIFDHDFDLTNELRVLQPVSTHAGGFAGIHGKPGSPYAIGYSLLSIPFIALGTLVDRIAGNPMDGYSTYVMYSYRIELVILSVTGLLLLTRALQRIGVGARAAMFVSFVMFFGTSVGYYTFSPMSHASTFMAASAFLLCWLRVRESGRVRDWLLLGAIGGCLSVCRWQDSVFLMAPLLCDLIRERGLRHWRGWGVYMAVIPIWWVPQFLEWKAIYGRFLLIPQGSGFLQFPPRYVLEVLFSTNHGWFLWTPLTLIGVAGLLYGAVRLSREYVPWLVVIALEVAVIGSMPTNWNCRDSFSIRSLTSCVPLVAVGFALLFKKRQLRVPVALAAIVCAVFSTLFAVQFRLDLIPRQSALSWEQVFAGKARLMMSPLGVLRGRGANQTDRSN